jgi:hypothetical protein
MYVIVLLAIDTPIRRFEKQIHLLESGAEIHGAFKAHWREWSLGFALGLPGC